MLTRTGQGGRKAGEGEGATESDEQRGLVAVVAVVVAAVVVVVFLQ